MKIKFFLGLTVLFLSNLWNAQQSCGCKDALQKIIFKIENEYPGFETKTKDKFLYENLKENTLKSSGETINEEECLKILTNYTGFFKDRHIWVLPNTVDQPKPSTAISTKPLKINQKKFRKEVQKQKDGFEGVWKDNAYEVGIKKISEKEYIGFIINADPAYWKPGEIKFRLFADGSYEYYTQDHSLQKGTYQIYKNSFLYFNNLRSGFTRQAPQSLMSTEEIDSVIGDLNGIFVKKISPKTAMIKLQYFSYSYVKIIENLIERNKELLEGAEFWIIDVRGNGGGTDNAYKNILPYLITNPVRNVGAEYLASPTLIHTSENYLKGIMKDSIKNRVEISDLKTRIDLLKNNPGKYINYNQDKINIDRITQAAKSPSQIVVLADNKTASAAENFLLKVRQSKKVKIMGIPSSGVLDYANAMFFEYGCSNYKLLLPTYRSYRLPDYPIDNIGVQPDIYLDSSIEDWVKFAEEYLEN